MREWYIVLLIKGISILLFETVTHVHNLFLRYFTNGRLSISKIFLIKCVFSKVFFLPIAWFVRQQYNLYSVMSIFLLLIFECVNMIAVMNGIAEIINAAVDH